MILALIKHLKGIKFQIWYIKHFRILKLIYYRKIKETVVSSFG
jgi:hypothetical protein